ncbi:hypothetical protein CTE07_34940 [Chitinophaga terrae (ex Kim and Jung 2007)]|nr:hypothetical protein CTE07_34940 [Chitinophaga terrae (ex Kim and Jung 2007)]
MVSAANYNKKQTFNNRKSRREWPLFPPPKGHLTPLIGYVAYFPSIVAYMYPVKQQGSGDLWCNKTAHHE